METTRTADRRTVRTPLEQFCVGLCVRAKIRYAGVQCGYDNGKGKVIPAQMMFDNKFGSTLCLPIGEGYTLSVELIQKTVKESEDAWAAAHRYVSE